MKNKIKEFVLGLGVDDVGIAAVKDGRAETIQVEYNLLAQEPAERIFPLAHQADVGIIAVDRHGNPVARHRTRDMPHAYFSGEGAVVARARV